MTEGQGGPTIGEQKICPNPNCQFDKHTTRANFCILCGTLLYHRCENCLDENPMYAHFCHFCGANLEELRLERMQEPGDESPVDEAPQIAQETEGPAQADEPEPQETEDEKENENEGNIFGNS